MLGLDAPKIVWQNTLLEENDLTGLSRLQNSTRCKRGDKYALRSSKVNPPILECLYYILT